MSSGFLLPLQFLNLALPHHCITAENFILFKYMHLSRLFCKYVKQHKGKGELCHKNCHEYNCMKWCENPSKHDKKRVKSKYAC